MENIFKAYQCCEWFWTNFELLFTVETFSTVNSYSWLLGSSKNALLKSSRILLLPMFKKLTQKEHFF